MPLPQGPSLRRSLALLAAVAVLAGGAFVALRAARSRPPAPLTLAASLYPAPRPLPEFVLATSAGARFGRRELLGHWTLLTFGFSNCPDACPTTLTELALARRELAGLPAPRVPAVVFVSVDPARDTPERLAGYLPQFDRAFTAVTGAPAALAPLQQACGVVAILGRAESGSYAVEHSSAVFLVDPEARLAAVFPAPQSAQVLSADYRAIVSARDRS